MTNLVDVELRIIAGYTTAHTEKLRFTNVDMELVKKAIDLLNGEAPRVDNESRTKDFTVAELLPMGSGVDLGIHKDSDDNMPVSVCQECGALVSFYSFQLHTNWHNKLLP